MEVRNASKEAQVAFTFATTAYKESAMKTAALLRC